MLSPLDANRERNLSIYYRRLAFPSTRTFDLAYICYITTARGRGIEHTVSLVERITYLGLK